MKNCLLEIACFNPDSAIIASESGADRIELCDDLTAGGITPSNESFNFVKKNCTIDIFVMIRPRGGNFEYSCTEFEKMKADILKFKDQNANGFVFGILKGNSIDIDRNLELVQLASPLPCTFHRAFDTTLDYKQALADIIQCGFKRVLTSGTKRNAEEGITILSEINKMSDGRIIILPGGGVRSENCENIFRSTSAIELHSSAITGNTEIADGNEIKKIKKIISS